MVWAGLQLQPVTMCSVHNMCSQPEHTASAGTMREKDECGPNIGLVRLLIYLCQADFNTGATDLSRLSSPSPDAESVNTEHLNRKQLYLCACITERERDPNDIYNVSWSHGAWKEEEAVHWKNTNCLITASPRRVERRGVRSDNFGHSPGFPPVTGFTSLAWTLGQNTVGRRGPGKVHFNILMIMMRVRQDKGYY